MQALTAALDAKSRVKRVQPAVVWGVAPQGPSHPGLQHPPAVVQLQGHHADSVAVATEWTQQPPERELAGQGAARPAPAFAPASVLHRSSATSQRRHE